MADEKTVFYAHAHGVLLKELEITLDDSPYPECPAQKPSKRKRGQMDDSVVDSSYHQGVLKSVMARP